MTDHYPALLRYCAYQDRCKADVIQKMEDIDVPATEQADILEKLFEENYLNERRFLGSYIRGKHFHNGWGRNKIRHYLHHKGFSTSEINAAFDDEISETVYQASILARINKYTRLKKIDVATENAFDICTALVKLGYESDLVRRVLDDQLKSLS